MVFLYITLAVSLDLVAGHAGALSVGQAAFYGVGAYTTAILATEYHLGFWPSLLGSICIAVALSSALSFPSLRIHGDYFVIATFAFQLIVLSVLNNWADVTRGPLGIPNIPRPVVIGWTVDSTGKFLVLSGLVAAITCAIVWRITRSPYGRLLHALRDDELFAKSLGKDTVRARVHAFALSAGLASLAGSLYAYYVTYIDPTSFAVNESILILSMVIVGGAGSRLGPVVGAAVLVLVPEVLRMAGFSVAAAANLRQMTYGALLVVMMLFRPRGLVGSYAFGR